MVPLVPSDTYRSGSRPARRPPTTRRYHRLGLFPPRYCQKSVGNDRCQPSHPLPSSISQGRRKKRENLEIRHGSPSTIPIRSRTPQMRCRLLV
ncbi:hypothetical protein B296_00041417 [Ensete ventricosum]|uniref:Uncharacterized protein n=1 Tax=Ensete ventricosum TaxID=4639 RepID=A0A426ZLX6_ENSVE|nr:hypothetical protein B296_00041417 [Ensete ventricosum]